MISLERVAAKFYIFVLQQQQQAINLHEKHFFGK